MKFIAKLIVWFVCAVTIFFAAVITLGSIAVWCCYPSFWPYCIATLALLWTMPILTWALSTALE